MSLEHAMSQLILPVRAHLGRRDFLHFEERRPLRLLADCGTLWVTLDGEPDDIEIKAGSSRVFDGHAAITVGTLGGPAVLSAQPLSQSNTWPERLRAAAQRWWPATHLERAP
jgi:hypothetical protein